VSDLALIVSICSATFTGGGLVAQYLLYRFNGARLKVQLVFCFRTDWGLTMSCTGPRRRISFERWREGRNIGLGIEYAKVRVTNIGRTPVSVEDISFDTGATDGSGDGENQKYRCSSSIPTMSPQKSWICCRRSGSTQVTTSPCHFICGRPLAILTCSSTAGFAGWSCADQHARLDVGPLVRGGATRDECGKVSCPFSEMSRCHLPTFGCTGRYGTTVTVAK
jgi:hypothetical protein